MDAKTAIKDGFADSMLYSDKQTANDDVMNFAFSRHMVLNCANESIRRLKALEQPPAPPDTPETDIARARLALQLKL